MDGDELGERDEGVAEEVLASGRPFDDVSIVASRASGGGGGRLVVLTVLARTLGRLASVLFPVRVVVDTDLPNLV